MNEEDARAWVAHRYGEPAAHMLARFGDLVAQENRQQNLIAASTIETMWTRHLLDSAQLVRFAPAAARRWIDVGTGAGFPGIVTAVLFAGQTILVEPRARRVAFLREAVNDLGLSGRVTVHHARVETLQARTADVVTARAVAAIASLLDMTAHVTTSSTTFILPRGRSGVHEVETLKGAWHGTFHVEHSLTDAASTIIIASGVTRACSASR